MDNSYKKKSEQLGMSPSTASSKLIRDLLWNFVRESNPVCYKCGKLMSRDTFSIEHKQPWLDSIDPFGLFFDIENISYTHLSCNISDRRTTKKNDCGTYAKYRQGCRCELCNEANRKRQRDTYSTEKRRARYKKTGS